MKTAVVCAVICASLLLSLPALSEEPTSTVPRSAFFFGLGGSANSLNFNNQKVSATGLSNVYNSSGAQVSSGSATGPPVNLGLGSEFTFAPSAQLGYFRHFGDTKWLWGAKVSYSYLRTTSTVNDFRIPQTGSFAGSVADPFTGNAVVKSYQATINHQISFMPFIGRSFDTFFVYVGGGPTLSQTETKVNELVGYADISGTRTNITGTPQSFSSSEWVLGGAGTVGGTYFFDRSWFLDFNYTYAVTENQIVKYTGTFNNPTSTYRYAGTLNGSSSGSITTQSFALLINMAFGGWE